MLNSDARRHKPGTPRARSECCRGRYAPSPTGPQHLGNARTALVAWLQCRLADGVFVLRMEDLDRPRVRPGSARQALDDLAWMGIDWDEGGDASGEFAPYEQSRRDQFYERALEQLRHLGLVFACACSRRDVADAASAPHGKLPLYPGTCRVLDTTQVMARCRATGRRPAWRFRVADQAVRFDDRVYGMVVQNLAQEVGDFVVRRADRLFAYQLAVAVDDALMGITDVVRGADLIESTPRQIALLQALDLPVPCYWHVPLMTDDGGRRLSKRDGALSIQEFRAGGGTPQALVGHLAASLGLAPPAPITCQELLATHTSTSLRDALIRAVAVADEEQNGAQETSISDMP